MLGLRSDRRSLQGPGEPVADRGDLDGATAGRLRPFVDAHPPILLWCTGIARCQVDVEMGDGVTEDDAVHVLGSFHFPQRSRKIVHENPEDGSLLIGRGTLRKAYF